MPQTSHCEEIALRPVLGLYDSILLSVCSCRLMTTDISRRSNNVQHLFTKFYVALAQALMMRTVDQCAFCARLLVRGNPWGETSELTYTDESLPVKLCCIGYVSQIRLMPAEAGRALNGALGVEVQAHH